MSSSKVLAACFLLLIPFAACQDPVPPNQAPVSTTPIPDQQLLRGDRVQIPMSSHFSDPDGDPLTYTATSSNAEVAVLSVSGSTVTVAADIQGTATATVTATDPGGLSASQSFTVTVPNRAPEVAAPISLDAINTGDSVMVDLSEYFTDPDGDPLTYTAASSDSAVVRLSVSEATVGITAMSPGTATATVTATDPGGLSVSQSFTVTVPNRPPMVAAAISLVRIGHGEPVTLDMPEYFSDPDGDPLDYAAASSDSAVVRLSVSDAAVEVMPVSLGTATATITATDPGGLSVSQTFTVTVVPSERDALAALYNATNGANWANNANWMTDRPLGQWFGVEVSAGHVTRLDLWENNLSGTIPPEIGNLGGLEWLELGNNRIEGEIPPEIGNLTGLRHLSLGPNRLTGEIPPEIGNLTELWFLSLALNNLTGEIPPEIGNMIGLRHLRLFANDLSGSIPPEIGNLTHLWEMWASFNEFTGPLPPEMGKLTNLAHVWLYWNRIEGPLPAELGDAANLRDLRLELNEISGPLPPELGKLDRLERLELSVNRLSGPIPPEFGNLSSLRTLAIHSYENRLTGELPPELGRLGNLVELILPGNELTGALPPELGDLGSLQVLQLAGNDLSGPVPPRFGGLAELRELTVSNNTDMSGELPVELTDLSNLNTLATGGTELCAPLDSGFQAWLRSVQKRRVRTCGGSGRAYLTQAVQSRDYPVPLVAGEGALLRVFLTASATNDEDIPGALARFYADGSEIHSQRLAGKAGPTPTEVLEGDLAKSLNAEVGPEVIRSGLEVVIEVDPVDAGLGVPTRIPATGRLQVEVYPVSRFDVVAIPFLWSPDPDSSIIGTVAELARDPDGHDLLRETRDLLPVNAVDVTAHDPVATSSNFPITLLMQTEAIRVAEGGSEYYMGTMGGVSGGIAGVGFVPGKSTFSIPEATVIAHEFGHNLSLLHAPCHVDGDPAYPYAGGRIGAWGWDGSQLIEPDVRDLMGYCRPNWISDFHFANAIRYRASLGDTIAERSRSPVRSLLVWGGIGEDGELFLEPAFAIDAPPSLPSEGDAHLLVGRDADGRELFSLSFGMQAIADGEGAAAFVFALPVQEEWERLASITLSGSGDSVTLDGDSERSMAILRDRETGQVLAIVDDLPPTTRTHADAVALLSPGPDFVLRFSRGIPDREAWR